MKKWITATLMLIVMFTLIGCGNDEEETTATAEFIMDDESITTDSITFGIEVDDPDEVITGSLFARLYKEGESTQTDSRELKTETDYETITFSRLDNDQSYEIKIHATVGRDTFIIGETTFRPLSTETITIETTEEFLDMKSNRAGNYVLENDLDFSGVDFVSPFTSSFMGSFDGGGHTLSNITFQDITTYTGVFGYVSSGSIKDLVLDTVTIGTTDNPLPQSTSSRVGILAGYISSSTAEIENITIRNSVISYTTSSTIHAYSGIIVGENKGSITNVEIENSSVHLTSTSHGRIKVAGAVGYLGEDATLKEIKSDVDVMFTLEAGTHSDENRDFIIYVGGFVADNNARNKTYSVEDIQHVGDVTADLDFNTEDGNDGGSYTVYVGGFVAGNYATLRNAFVEGSLTVNHQKNDFDDEVYKSFNIGGVFGIYDTGRDSESILRLGDGQTIDLTITDDVILRASQTVGRNGRAADTGSALFGETHLELNGVSIAGEDNATIIGDLTDFFTSDWIIDAYESMHGPITEE